MRIAGILLTAHAEISEALEDNISDMKSVMQGRIGETETRLGQLQSWQEELAGKQEEFQTNGREEIFNVKTALESSTNPQELPTCKPSFSGKSKLSAAEDLEYPDSKIRPLSVTTPVFISSAGSTTLCGGGGATNASAEGSGSTNMQCPPQFDGNSIWKVYRTQLAELNGWTEQQKATYLAISLRGSALTVLTNLPEEQRREYTALSAALQNNFGTTHQAELNQAQLQEGRNEERRCCQSYQRTQND